MSRRERVARLERLVPAVPLGPILLHEPHHGGVWLPERDEFVPLELLDPDGRAFVVEIVRPADADQ